MWANYTPGSYGTGFNLTTWQTSVNLYGFCQKGIVPFFGSFPFVPPQYVMLPQLQSTCHYIVNHYVKILHVHLGVANNMHPLSWGGTNGKNPFFYILGIYLAS